MCFAWNALANFTVTKNRWPLVDFQHSLLNIHFSWDIYHCCHTEVSKQRPKEHLSIDAATFRCHDDLKGNKSNYEIYTIFSRKLIDVSHLHNFFFSKMELEKAIYQTLY